MKSNEIVVENGWILDEDNGGLNFEVEAFVKGDSEPIWISGAESVVPSLAEALHLARAYFHHWASGSYEREWPAGVVIGNGEDRALPMTFSKIAFAAKKMQVADGKVDFRLTMRIKSAERWDKIRIYGPMRLARKLPLALHASAIYVNRSLSRLAAEAASNR